VTIADAVLAVALLGTGYWLASRRLGARAASLEAALTAETARGRDQRDRLASANARLSLTVHALQARSQELDETRRAAEQASRAKSEFLANISHEIRTPLTAIIGMTAVVLDTNPTDEQARYLRGVKTSADHLHSLVNDILDFSKIEAGRLALDPIAFRLRETVGATLELVARSAHEKGLELVHDIGPDVPDFVVGDPGRLRQILLNLVGNAIKFTVRGEVVVGVTAEARGADAVELRWTVRDTGIGIDPDKQQGVFTAFEQTDGSTTRRFGGTGLGLAISAHLVGLMRGRLGLDSVVGAGSTFHFTTELRRQAQPTNRATLAPPDAVRGRRALVVDDSDTARRATATMLRTWDLRVDEAGTGDEARRLVAACGRDDDAYAVVLLDATMPGMDGFEIAEAMARTDDGAPQAVVLMLPTHDLHRDLSRSRACGVSVTLTKPVTHQALLAAITRAIGGPDVSGLADERRGETSGGPRRSLRVLVAEDHELNQDLIGTLLRRRGHSSVVVGTGQAALEALDADGSPFDVVLMDVQMPELDGLEATRRIRRRERHNGRRVPVVGITAGVRADERDRCLAAGMDGLVTKPIDADDLFATIEGFTAGRIERTAAAPRPAHPIPDRVELTRRLGGDPDLLVRMIEAFLGDHPRTVGALTVAIRRQNARAIEHAAHRLRGAAAHFGAEDVVDCAAELERIARHGDLSSAEELFERLTVATAELCTVLGRMAEPRDDMPTSRTA